MKSVAFGITWFASHYIMLLPVFLVALGLLLFRLYKARRAIAVLARSRYARLLLQHVSGIKYILKTALFFIGMFFLFLAILRPQWNKKEMTVAQEGRDLFIAVDISRSMLVQDEQPNRLEAAKKKIKQLVKALKSERVGLILFSGETIMQCPLTKDSSAFFMFLDQLDVETISSGTTAIDKAIKKVIESFSSMPAKKSKILVLFTDGEDFSSDLAGVRSQATQQGLTIFTVGVGSVDGGPIPLFDTNKKQVGHQKDRENKIIISRLNEGILHNLAEQTGGRYLHLTKDDTDIKVITKAIDLFEKERFEDKSLTLLEEKYPYFLVVSFVCFILEWLL